MGKIYKWLGRIFHSRIKDLERELRYAHGRVDNLTNIVKILNNQVYYLNDHFVQQEQQIKELQKQLCQNT